MTYQTIFIYHYVEVMIYKVREYKIFKIYELYAENVSKSLITCLKITEWLL